MDIGGWSNVVVGIFSGQIGCRLRSRKDCVEGQLGRGALLSDSSVQVVAQTEWLTFDYWQSRASKCKVGCCISAVSESSRCCSGGVSGGHFFTVQQQPKPQNTTFYINLSQLCALVSPSVHSELFNLLKAFLFPPLFEKSCWTPFVNNGNLRRLKVWELICTYGDLLVNPEDCSPLVVSQTPFA